jgi:hypothetical protein
LLLRVENKRRLLWGLLCGLGTGPGVQGWLARLDRLVRTPGIVAGMVISRRLLRSRRCRRDYSSQNRQKQSVSHCGFLLGPILTRFRNGLAVEARIEPVGVPA